jgi:cell filamentation protein
VTDPYLLPGTSCLRNKLGIDHPGELAAVEFQAAMVQDVELARQTLPGAHDLAHLRAFHRKLFGDVYDWAGEIRTVDIRKGGPWFCRPHFIEERLRDVFEGLKSEKWLQGLALEYFVERLAYYYGEINAIHPFREGNGRTQRAFLRQLAAAARYRLDWSKLDAAANIRACARNMCDPDLADLVNVLTPVVSRIQDQRRK